MKFLFSLILFFVLACNKKVDSNDNSTIKTIPFNLEALASYVGNPVNNEIFKADVDEVYRNKTRYFDFYVISDNAPIKDKYRVSLRKPDDDIYVTNLTVGPIVCDRTKSIEQAKYFEALIKKQVYVRGYFDVGPKKFNGSQNEFYDYLKTNPDKTGYVFYKTDDRFGNFYCIEIGLGGIWFMNQPSSHYSNSPIYFK